jgi:hypothetical protein
MDKRVRTGRLAHLGLGGRPAPTVPLGRKGPLGRRAPTAKTEVRALPVLMERMVLLDLRARLDPTVPMVRMERLAQVAVVLAASAKGPYRQLTSSQQWIPPRWSDFILQ